MYYGLIENLMNQYLNDGEFNDAMGKVQEALRTASDKDRLALELHQIAMKPILDTDPDGDICSFALETLAGARAGYNDYVLEIILHFIETRKNSLMFVAIASASDLPLSYRIKVYPKVLEIPIKNTENYVYRAGLAFQEQFKDVQYNGSGI